MGWHLLSSFFRFCAMPNSKFHLGEGSKFSARRCQASSHPQRGILFWGAIDVWRSSSFLVGFFIVVMPMYAHKSSSLSIPCAVRSTPSRCRQHLTPLGLSAFVVGPRRFSGPSLPPPSPLQAGSAPRGQFTVDGSHHSGSYTPAPNMWHEKSSTFPLVSQVMCAGP